MYDIITVGSSTVDVFAETDKKFVHKKEFCFPIGAKLLVKHMEIHTGGGGTNCGVALARLGLKVAYLGKMGIGENSNIIINTLKKENVDTSLVCRKEGRTGYSVILDAEHSDRTIFAYKGSNDDLSIKEVNLKKLKTKWFYFSSMLKKSFKTQEKLAKYAEQNNIKIAFNISQYLAKKGWFYNRNILKRTEVLILNKDEAELLVKKKKIEDQLKAIFKRGPNIIVITDANNPVHAYDGENDYIIYPHGVPIVETTGAGDAFAASFVAGLMRKDDVKFALQVGLANAESVIQHYGAKNRLLHWSTVVNHIRKNPGKIIVKKI